MKRIAAFFLATVMALSMSLAVFAAPGSFVSSPSENTSPIVIKFDPEDENCTAQLVITPYGDRDELPDAILAMLEQAYKDIAGTKDLTTLNAALAKLAASKKIAGENLAVANLFDIHVTGCDYHEEHRHFDITLDADALSHFVGLLHMKKSGEWELVEDAEVTNNGDHLEFSVDEFSPFAIVVDATEEVPDSGDNTMIYVYVVLMATSALGIVLIAAKLKKQRG